MKKSGRTIGGLLIQLWCWTAAAALLQVSGVDINSSTRRWQARNRTRITVPELSFFGSVDEWWRQNSRCVSVVIAASVSKRQPRFMSLRFMLARRRRELSRDDIRRMSVLIRWLVLPLISPQKSFITETFPASYLLPVFLIFGGRGTEAGIATWPSTRRTVARRRCTVCELKMIGVDKNVQ